jgi:hypothetical protein
VSGRIEQPLGTRALAVVALGVAGVAFLATLVRSDDPDMFHHLALGREVLRLGWPPAAEPFLYPLRGQTTGPLPYWLGSLVIYGSHAAFGEAGLSFLPAAVGAALAVVLLLDAAPRGGPHRLASLACAALPVALALETYRYRAVARTEIFSALLLAVTMWAIRRFEDGRPRALLVVPALAVLWTNLHPATALALAALAVVVAAGAAQAILHRATGRLLPGTPTWRQLATAAAVGVATALASLVTPSPANPLRAALSFAAATLGLDGGRAAGADGALANALAAAGELRGGGAALWGTPAGVLVALTAASFLLRPRAIRPRELLTFAAFAALPFEAVRYAVFAAIVAAPIAARNLAGAVAALPARPGGVPLRGAAAAALAIAALASAPLGAQAPHIRFGAGLAPGAFPVRGVDYLEAARFEGRLFNTFHLGGYLEWRRVGPAFQDGRGGTLPEDAAGAIAGPLDPVRFAGLDGRYRFDALLLAYPDPSTAPLAAMGVFDPDAATWALVAFDDGGLLYLRRTGRYAELAARDAFRSVAPASPEFVRPPPDLPAALAELRRSVAEAPGCLRCRFFLGEVALAAGLPEEAAAAVAPALAQARGEDREVLASVAARAAETIRRTRAAQQPR